MSHDDHDNDDNRWPTTRDDLLEYLYARNNWQRWGADDQRGAINLIGPAERLAALSLARSGRCISLSREVPTQIHAANPLPAQHFVRMRFQADRTGIATDYYGMQYHGYQTTHVDALCHVWDERGFWGGRDPRREVLSDGTRWGGIEHWSDGIVARGILLDVPAYRQTEYVTLDRPVGGRELQAIAASHGVEPRPGDALAVYCGRERFEAAHPDWRPHADARPGLDASCLAYLRDRDIAVLCWDMLDAAPNPYGLPWTVHAALPAFGVALVDNCSLASLALACQSEGRVEFALIVAPLVVRGGTGSPVNPLALL